MKKTNTRDLTLMAVLTALSVVLAYIHVPTPTGYLTLLDVGIYFTAYYLGSKSGAIVGGLSGFHSLIAHGAQGFFAGWNGKKRILGLVLASVSMIGWYFVAALLLGYGLGAAWAGILGNVLQNFFGMFVGYLVYLAYLRFEKH